MQRKNNILKDNNYILHLSCNKTEYQITIIITACYVWSLQTCLLAQKTKLHRCGKKNQTQWLGLPGWKGVFPDKCTVKEHEHEWACQLGISRTGEGLCGTFAGPTAWTRWQGASCSLGSGRCCLSCKPLGSGKPVHTTPSTRGRPPRLS